MFIYLILAASAVVSNSFQLKASPPHRYAFHDASNFRRASTVGTGIRPPVENESTDYRSRWKDEPFDLITSLILAAYSFEAYNNPPLGKLSWTQNNVKTTYTSTEYTRDAFDGVILLTINKGTVKYDDSSPFLERILTGAKPDPYVIIASSQRNEMTGDRVVIDSIKSSTMSNNPNPAWSENHSLFVKYPKSISGTSNPNGRDGGDSVKELQEVDPGVDIEFAVFDQQQFSDDVFVGSASVSLDDILRSSNQVDRQTMKPLSLPIPIYRIVEESGDGAADTQRSSGRGKVDNKLLPAEHAILARSQRRKRVRTGTLLMSIQYVPLRHTQEELEGGGGEEEAGTGVALTIPSMRIDTSNNDASAAGTTSWGLDGDGNARFVTSSSSSTATTRAPAVAPSSIAVAPDESSSSASLYSRELQARILKRLPSGATPASLDWTDLLTQVLLFHAEQSLEPQPKSSGDTATATATATAGSGASRVQVEEAGEEEQEQDEESLTTVVPSLLTGSLYRGNMHQICAIDSLDVDTQCMLYADLQTRQLVVSFRGTEMGKLQDVLTDINFFQVPFLRPSQQEQLPDLKDVMVHQGFYNAYKSVQGELLQQLMLLFSSTRHREEDADADSSDTSSDNDGEAHGGDSSQCHSDDAGASAGWDVYITGHSLGGALAKLFAFDLARIRAGYVSRKIMRKSSRSSNSTTSGSIGGGGGGGGGSVLEGMVAGEEEVSVLAQLLGWASSTPVSNANANVGNKGGDKVDPGNDNNDSGDGCDDGNDIAGTYYRDEVFMQALQQSQLRCYSYGAPRVGNTAFRDQLNRWVPHLFRVVNSQDVVARLPRTSQASMIVDYEHAGRTVLIEEQLQTSVTQPSQDTKTSRTSSGRESGNFRDTTSSDVVEASGEPIVATTMTTTTNPTGIPLAHILADSSQSNIWIEGHSAGECPLRDRSFVSLIPPASKNSRNTNGGGGDAAATASATTTSITTGWEVVLDSQTDAALKFNVLTTAAVEMALLAATSPTASQAAEQIDTQINTALGDLTRELTAFAESYNNTINLGASVANAAFEKTASGRVLQTMGQWLPRVGEVMQDAVLPQAAALARELPMGETVSETVSAVGEKITGAIPSFSLPQIPQLAGTDSSSNGTAYGAIVGDFPSNHSSTSNISSSDTSLTSAQVSLTQLTRSLSEYLDTINTAAGAGAAGGGGDTSTGTSTGTGVGMDVGMNFYPPRWDPLFLERELELLKALLNQTAIEHHLEPSYYAAMVRTFEGIQDIHTQV